MVDNLNLSPSPKSDVLKQWKHKHETSVFLNDILVALMADWAQSLAGCPPYGSLEEWKCHSFGVVFTLLHQESILHKPDCDNIKRSLLWRAQRFVTWWANCSVPNYTPILGVTKQGSWPIVFTWRYKDFKKKRSDFDRCRKKGKEQ